MYAIIEDGAHQYKVEEGDTFEVQRRDLPDDQTTIEFDRVVMLGDGADSSQAGSTGPRTAQENCQGRC